MKYIYLMRLDKPIGIALLLWPTLWALWLATAARPDIKIVLVFILGTILMRSAGCIMNDIADRNFDKHVERTRNRPLTSGQVSVKEALVLAAILSLVALFLVLKYLNHYALYLSFVGAAFAVIYPYLKRVTHLPQLGLGFAFAWGVPMAFAATNNHITAANWVVFIATMIWIIAYDTQYAMVDRADDEKIGIKSTAILFGNKDIYILTGLQIVFLLLLGDVGFLYDLSWPYYAGVAIAALIFCYQQWIVHHREPSACFRAFLSNNWVGGVIFLGILCK